MTTVVQAAWIGAGRPRLNQKPVAGVCARCGTETEVSTTAVVSKTFTSFEEWCVPGGPTCAPCGWGYTHAPLRLHPHLVDQNGGLRQLTREQVKADLMRSPVQVSQAIVVPLRPGRKHVLPRAQWGQVTIEDLTVAWTVQDCARLAAVDQLRAHGFTSAALASPTPPFGMLRRHPADQWATILQHWDLVEPWRSARHLLELAIALTHPQRAAA